MKSPMTDKTKSRTAVSRLSEMTIYCALKMNERQVKMMSDHDIMPHYYRYLPLFEEYLCMQAEGSKKGFIVAKLAEHHKVSESTVKRVIKALSRRVTP